MSTSASGRQIAARRGRPRDADADERIRHAAAELLLERGVDGTTVDAVPERAGVGKATVYRRWASKEDLALAACGDCIKRDLPVPDTGSFLGDLTEIYGEVIDFAQTERGALFRLSATESARDPRVAELHRNALADRLEECGPVFDRAVERGELHPEADRRMIFEWPIGLMMLRTLIGADVPTRSDAASMAQAAISGMAWRPSS
jgi:AcrR family transcriptional regulator